MPYWRGHALPPKGRAMSMCLLYIYIPCLAEKEYKLGHLGYYADNRGMEKQTVDSLFILKRGRDGKFEHTVINARLAGML